ncbi:hypothetical protein SAMN05421805_106272 [Saccharopolyspora antimicrobica]|uniref:Uncharacterized protein n=1 Tax=Saccharopolyspora antimicrobica TaxID=455193 RepID=A0A1I5BI70_9PSEU|nr:hypothetical protein [Saccharopolyspora antimicrobica]RKT86619.1 hypothetical protein ATL45_4997 [Saccharopolyspora antimicrobica]SFN74350.1 hypothetical protein SAMN05421805_106272 [Saccharopolyspora antimicrobica]
MIEVLSARAFWCAPDEKILWCHPLEYTAGKAGYVYYQVSGLDERGDKRWTAGKVIGGVASGVAGLALEAISPTDEASGNPGIPKAVVSGQSRDCLAASQLGAWQATGVNGKSGREFIWILTSHRLGLLESSAKESESVAGLLGGLKKKISGGSDEQGGSPLRAVQLPTLTVHAEFPRNIIANVSTVEYKVKGKERKFLRVSLVDGSTLDLTARGESMQSADTVDRLLAMTFGQV